MIKQLSLFDRPPETFKPLDPTVPESEKPRLNEQCRRILARLRGGPATNSELVSIAMNLTARISDIRNKGFVITCFDRQRGGLCWYRLDHDLEGG